MTHSQASKLNEGVELNRMKNENGIKVLHLPSVTGGNPQGLSWHLNQIGLQSETWALYQNYFCYPADKVILSKTDNIIWSELKRLWALRYVFKSDVVFYNFGQTLFCQYPSKYNGKKGLHIRLAYPIYRLYAKFMQKLEIALVKLQKKILLVQYQGDDARQGDYSLLHFSFNIASQVEDGYYSVESDALKREQIKIITRVCFKTYALNPDLLHVLPEGSEFLPYSHISLNEWTPYFTQLESRPLRIGHAPSHRGVKGTALVLAALDLLKAEGFKFELILVEGLSNAQAKEQYKLVDVMVDQLFAGWYGCLAVEVMALGKPVIAYIRDDDLKFIPSEMKSELPIIRCTPTNIYAVLRQVFEMPRTRLLEVAKKSRSYVERWHDPLKIANRIKSDIQQAIAAKHN
jgi:hypothetical protein